MMLMLFKSIQTWIIKCRIFYFTKHSFWCSRLNIIWWQLHNEESILQRESLSKALKRWCISLKVFFFIEKLVFIPSNIQLLPNCWKRNSTFSPLMFMVLIVEGSGIKINNFMKRNDFLFINWSINIFSTSDRCRDISMCI